MNQSTDWRSKNRWFIAHLPSWDWGLCILGINSRTSSVIQSDVIFYQECHKISNSSCLYTSTHGKCRAVYLIITYRTPPPTPLIIALYLLDNQTSLNLHRWSTQDLAQQLITTLWWVLFTWKMLRGACWDCLSRHLAPQWWSPYTGGQWNVIKFTLWETSHAPSVRSCLYVNLINNSRFWLNKTLKLWKYFTRLDLHYSWRCWFLIQKFGWNSVSFAGDMIWVWPGRRGMVAANCCNISWYQLVITVRRNTALRSSCKLTSDSPQTNFLFSKSYNTFDVKLLGRLIIPPIEGLIDQIKNI